MLLYLYTVRLMSRGRPEAEDGYADLIIGFFLFLFSFFPNEQCANAESITHTTRRRNCI